jgi:hypothetical protein
MEADKIDPKQRKQWSARGAYRCLIAIVGSNFIDSTEVLERIKVEVRSGK